MDAESLDVENRAAAERYLVAQGYCGPNEPAGHEVLAGGVSSRTVRITFVDGRQWVLKQALAKLRVAADWFSDPRRVHREALGMRVLGELAPPGAIPRLVFDDERHHVLGMEAVPPPHENWKALLLAGRVRVRHAADFGALLAVIHRNSHRRRRELERDFADRSYFESLRIEPYYQYSAAQEPRAAEFFRRLIDDTRANLLALTHGDYSPKNVLVRDDRLVLLDHEVVHWGDPWFDFGFAMAHLLSKWHHLPEHRPELRASIDLFVKSYLEGIVDCPWLAAQPDRGVRHALGCLLARVVGRSPLEYLSPEERARQRETVVRLLGSTDNLPELLERFTNDVGERGA